MPTLFIFGGLPGTGKTLLSRELARRSAAVHLRIDTIEQALRDAGAFVTGREGYAVAYALTADNLRLARDVVADSVNPLRITRDAWQEVAQRAGAAAVEIEVVCSDPAEHRARVEARSTDVPGLKLPSWRDVAAREYEPWDRAHLVIDTAGETPARSLARLLDLLAREHLAT